MSSLTPHSIIVPDCRHLIFHYYIFNLSQLKKLHKWRRNDRDWNFMAKYAHCCHLEEGMDQVVFLSDCRHQRLKPSFYYLKFDSLRADNRNRLYPYLRGIHSLEISRMAPLKDETTDRFFENIRGVKHLSLSSHQMNDNYFNPRHFANIRGIESLKLTKCNIQDDDTGNCFENLIGIQKLSLRHCNIVLTHRHFHFLRGIQELVVYECGFRLTKDSFKYLRGIRKLSLSLGAIPLKDQHVQDLRGLEELHLYTNTLNLSMDDLTENIRGIKVISITACSGLFLTPLCLENLRGARVFHMEDVTSVQHIVNDESFRHLRGATDIRIFGFPNLTDRVFEHFKGIKKLRISRCPNIHFLPHTMKYLNGIKVLEWSMLPTCAKRLHEDCLRPLSQAKILDLDDVVPYSNDIFRYFSGVEELSLGSNLYCPESIPLSESAFRHLTSVKKLKLKYMLLDGVQSFSHMVRSCMPQLQHLKATDCRVLQFAILPAFRPDPIRVLDSFEDSDLDDCDIASIEYGSEK